GGIRRYNQSPRQRQSCSKCSLERNRRLLRQRSWRFWLRSFASPEVFRSFLVYSSHHYSQVLHTPQWGRHPRLPKHENPNSKLQIRGKIQIKTPKQIELATASILCLSANYLSASCSLIKLHRCARSFKESRTP